MKREREREREREITRTRDGNRMPGRTSTAAMMRSGGGDGRGLSRSTAQGDNRARLLSKTGTNGPSNS